MRVLSWERWRRHDMGALDVVEKYKEMLKKYPNPCGQPHPVLTDVIVRSPARSTQSTWSDVDFHPDWGASQFLSKQIFVGLVGYLYNEICCDSGAGDWVGCFQSRVVPACLSHAFSSNARTTLRVDGREEK